MTDNGSLERAFRAAQRLDSLRALAGQPVEVTLEGRPLRNLLNRSIWYTGDMMDLVTMICYARPTLGAMIDAKLVVGTGVPVGHNERMTFPSTEMLMEVASLLGRYEPLAVKCSECGEWSGYEDVYDLSKYRPDFALCVGCALTMTAEDLIEGYLR